MATARKPRASRNVVQHAPNSIRLLTEQQAADMLHVSRYTILRELDAGRLEYVRVRSLRRIPEAALVEYVKRFAVSGPKT